MAKFYPQRRGKPFSYAHPTGIEDVVAFMQTRGQLDITEWLGWFLRCLLNTMEASETILGKVIFKHNFWLEHASKIDNERQRKVLNLLLDGFDGKLNTSKWAKICKCSQDTALRDIQDLINKQIFYKMPGGGRSTNYAIKTKD